MYAMPAMYSLLTLHDISRLDSFLHKANRWGLTSKNYNINILACKADSKLFSSIQKRTNHCLAQLLPTKRPVYTSKLRHRAHHYSLPLVKTELHKQSFPNRCLFKRL